MRCLWCGGMQVMGLMGDKLRVLGLVGGREMVDYWCSGCERGVMYIGGVLGMVWGKEQYSPRRIGWNKIPDGCLFVGRVEEGE